MSLTLAAVVAGLFVVVLVGSPLWLRFLDRNDVRHPDRKY